MRTLRVALFASVLLALVPALFHYRVARAQNPRPNVVVIVTDDQNIDTLPTMRKLMAYPEGQWVNFTNAFVGDAICCPSRATLLTGQYSYHHGVLTNKLGASLDDSKTVAVSLDNAGYETGMFGKYLNNFPFTKPLNYVPPGWDVFGGNTEPDETSTDEERWVSAAEDFLDETTDPFFLYLAFTSPHRPAVPQPPYVDTAVPVPPDSPNFNEADVSDKPAWIRNSPLLTAAEIEPMRTERLNVHRELLTVDDGIQRIVDALKANGQLDNTMIIFLGDNGYSWGSHRRIGKYCPYDECIRVPMLIRFPGQSGNRTESRFVANVDVVPTILDYTGAATTRPLDGRSLLPVITNTAAGWRDEVLLEKHMSSKYYGLRVPGWTYVEHENGERELYDMANDPFQMRNVAGQAAFRQTQAQLAQRLSELRTGTVAVHTVAGFVRTAGGAGIGGVLVSDGSGHSATTGSSGRYTLRNVPPGSYTLTPTKAGYTFRPATRQVTVPPNGTEQNFTGAPARTYTVTGLVTRSGGGALSGVTISDGVGHTAITGSTGRYTLRGLPPGTYTVTPAKTGYTFTPARRTLTVPPNATRQNFRGAR
jgi:arylsulfatase A-like enzyme